MFNMLVSSAVDRELKSQSELNKDYEIGICCFSAKHTALRGENKDWLALNLDNVERRVYSLTDCCFSEI